MDPKTQSEQMEDVRPNDRGFIDDDTTDVEAEEALEDGETSDED